MTPNAEQPKIKPGRQLKNQSPVPTSRCKCVQSRRSQTPGCHSITDEERLFLRQEFQLCATPFARAKYVKKYIKVTERPRSGGRIAYSNKYLFKLPDGREHEVCREMFCFTIAATTWTVRNYLGQNPDYKVPKDTEKDVIEINQNREVLQAAKPVKRLQQTNNNNKKQVNFEKREKKMAEMAQTIHNYVESSFVLPQPPANHNPKIVMAILSVTNLLVEQQLGRLEITTHYEPEEQETEPKQKVIETTPKSIPKRRQTSSPITPLGTKKPYATRLSGWKQSKEQDIQERNEIEEAYKNKDGFMKMLGLIRKVREYETIDLTLDD